MSELYDQSKFLERGFSPEFTPFLHDKVISILTLSREHGTHFNPMQGIDGMCSDDARLAVYGVSETIKTSVHHAISRLSATSHLSTFPKSFVAQQFVKVLRTAIKPRLELSRLNRLLKQHWPAGAPNSPGVFLSSVPTVSPHPSR